MVNGGLQKAHFRNLRPSLWERVTVIGVGVLGFESWRRERGEILSRNGVFWEAELSFQRCHCRGNKRSVVRLCNASVLVCAPMVYVGKFVLTCSYSSIRCGYRAALPCSSMLLGVGGIIVWPLGM